MTHESVRPGRLRIFFSYARGVGKRRALLRSVQARIEAGEDVVVGAFEADDLPDVRAALGRLEHLDPRAADKGEDLDLDAALARKPRVLIVAPLAHRNREGARHRRRYQDVAELLAAGIDVWTTLDVRHVESLADLCEQVAGIPTLDRVPDDVFDGAAEIDVVDGPVEDLLRHGEVELPGAEERLRPALGALREIALRRTADRLHQRLEAPRVGDADGRAWPTVERLLVCVGPSPTSARLIRAASRMASAMHARWTAVHVRPPSGREPALDAAVAAHLRLAEELGADTLALDGADAAATLVQHARAVGATKIVIGKTGRTLRSALFRGTVVDRVLDLCGDIDVYVVRGVEGPTQPARRHMRFPALLPLLGTSIVLAAATALCFLFAGMGHADVGRTLTYLLAVTFVAVTYGRGAAVAASFAAVLLFNFFFTEPRYTFVVQDPHYLFTFGVMLAIALLVSALATRARGHAETARLQARRTAALYELSRSLSATSGRLQIVAAATEQLGGLLHADVAILLPDEQGVPRFGRPPAPPIAQEAKTEAIAHWVQEHGRMAGAGTDTHGDAAVLCLPLASPDGVAGVLALRSRGPRRTLDPDERRHLETLASHIGLAIVRDRLTERIHRVLAQADAERLRNALLSSVSHDFRTPLAAISGTAGSLLVGGDKIRREEREDLLRSIETEADRLARLVENILHLTRIESGKFPLQAEWHVVEDLVGSALGRLAPRLAKHRVDTRIARHLPLLRVDGVLVEQALTNLLENAAKYAPEGTSIHIGVTAEPDRVVFEVADEGPGVPEADRSRVFEKFFRGQEETSSAPRGAGLGLAICHAVAALHGGKIWVEASPGGGARFLIALPIEAQPPEILEAPAE